MSEHTLTEVDIIRALINKGYARNQATRVLGDIKSQAWDEGAAAFQTAAIDPSTPLNNPYKDAS